MSFEFNLPNFQVATASERRMYSYLYQTVQQLNWAMKHIQTAEGSGNGYVPTKQISSTGKVSDGKTPMETFSEIKSLIIKSADIINAYYDSIHAKLEGLYVAQSEFGDYVEATKLELEANSKGITQNYTDIQGVQGSVSGLQGNINQLSDRISVAQTDLSGVRQDVDSMKGAVDGVQEDMDDIRNSVDALNTVIVETNAYIRTGAIDTDEYGIPIYGLEIGQTNEVNGSEIFNKYARFSSSRLSFYDQNDTEVAYISDYKLYITNVHITGTLTIGDYEIDTSDGLAFRWVGGES